MDVKRQEGSQGESEPRDKERREETGGGGEVDKRDEEMRRGEMR